ncbi:MAG: epoxide hydrolase, soluble (sEH) [Pleopsidium flavum]|nr:MAG: epoxide hydrolase, soluble (sEH) [Pleopsidium flavum]
MVNPILRGIDVPVEDIEELIFNFSDDEGSPPDIGGRTESHSPRAEAHLTALSSREISLPASSPSLPPSSPSPEPAVTPQPTSSPSRSPPVGSATQSGFASSPSFPPPTPPTEPAATPQPTSSPLRSPPVRSATQSGFASTTMNDSGSFAHGHHDNPQAVNYNFHGDRLVTGSSDHHLKVWNKQGPGQWQLVDTWRGHDAEIMEVKWTGPFMSEVVASIGEDHKFKVWEEDPTEALNSGRRFKCIYSQQTKFRVPYVSLDIKSYKFETYIALISRDGYLSLLEPTEPDSFGNWKEIDQFFVCTPPDRGEEAGFRVSFNHDPLPCYNAIAAGLDKNALSLAVAAMDTVKVYRATKLPDKDYQLYLAAELTGHGGLIRDVSWADGSVRGTDLIASACKDGFIRIFEITTPVPSDPNTTPQGHASQPAGGSTSDGSSSSTGARNAPSGIGAGLAGAFRTDGAMHRSEEYGCKVKHTWKLVAAMNAHDGAVWRVKFSRLRGEILASGGDDGITRLWKRAMTGEWVELAELNAE